MKIDFSGFVKVVNLLEGVDICVDQPIYDPDIEAQIDFGCQHFDGDTALSYVRSRKTTSDFDRSRRQQQIMVAVKDKALKLNFLLNPLKLNQALNILIGHFNTDIKTAELKELGFSIAKLTSHKISNYVLDNKKDNLLRATVIEGAAVLLPVGGDFQEIHKLVREKLP
jgi:anionic cell wall polymer biosynthesis LytR-Cps2A-Psr (LCP) family protein